jgi:hypothetical protein
VEYCTGQRAIARPFWPEEALLSVFGLPTCAASI